jgi:hypothetical protein
MLVNGKEVCRRGGEWVRIERTSEIRAVRDLIATLQKQLDKLQMALPQVVQPAT